MDRGRKARVTRGGADVADAHAGDSVRDWGASALFDDESDPAVRAFDSGASEEDAVEQDAADASDDLIEDADDDDDAGIALVVAGRGTGTALARLDPLRAYMNDVLRYPVLSHEEQHELAVRYVEHGDRVAAQRLVTSNLRLVVKIAYEYRAAYRNLLDLVQEGNVGLMQAVAKYDPYRGVKLSSYAAWWIRAYILRFILNNWRLVKIGTTQAQRKLFFNLQKEKAKLAAQGIEATAARIAESLDVTVEDVTSMDMRLSGSEVSLDAPAMHGSDDAHTLARVDLLSDGAVAADVGLARDQVDELMRERFATFGEKLVGKEAEIFRHRLLTEAPKTLQELGEGFGVSRERVRQLEKRVLTKLRRFLEEDLEADVLEAAAELI